MLTERVSSSRKRYPNFAADLKKEESPKTKKSRPNTNQMTKKRVVPLIFLCIFMFALAFMLHQSSSKAKVDLDIHRSHNLHHTDDDNKWVSFGGYAGLPYYFS